MKRIFCAIIAAALLCGVLLSAASCGALIDFIDDLPTVSQTDGSSDTSVTEPAQENKIPFTQIPEIVAYELPEEQPEDPLEAEASAIIDEAIAKAISYVSAMKDDRHSAVCVPYEEDADGYFSNLDENGRRFYDLIVSSGKSGEHITVTEEEFSGDLREFYFAIYAPMTYYEPGLSSYFTVEPKTYIVSYGDDDITTQYSKVYDRYFDPERDANTDLNSGSVTMEQIMHRAGLLDRVVKRIVRFMPEGLSAYDRYYYLAAVLSEQVSYDKRPVNCFSAYGALIGGRAVCEGYACAYYLLCREAGLWCAYRNGMPEGQGHMWNMVRLEDGIYNVDVTWCDGYGKPYERDWYDCFMRSDEAFEYDGHCAATGVSGTGEFAPSPYEDER